MFSKGILHNLQFETEPIFSTAGEVIEFKCNEFEGGKFCDPVCKIVKKVERK